MIKKTFRKLRGLWEDGNSTGNMVARGGVLLFIDRTLIKIIQFCSTVVVARVLFPQDVGLFGLAALTLSVADSLLQTGFNAAIVQYKEDVKMHLNSVWTLNIVRGLLLTILVYFVAPYAGQFFHNTAIVPIARVMSLLFLISGFQNVGFILYQKELKMNKIFFYDVLGNLSQVVVVIVIAVTTRSVWALAFGSIALRLAFVVLSYIMHPYRPRLSSDMGGARQLFRFGKWIGLTGVLTFLVNQGDAITVGKLLNASDLAYYNLAFALGTLPAIELVSTIGNILMPLYSRVDSVGILKDMFSRVSLMVYSLMIPATAGLIVLARDIVFVVYGSRWLSMVPVLYMIALYGLVSSFDYMAQPLLNGMGKPKTPLVSLLVRGTVMAILIVPLTKGYGVLGTAFVMFIGMCAAQLVQFWRIRREIGVGFGSFIGNTYLSAIASVIMVVLLYAMKHVIVVSSAGFLIVFVLLGVVIYAGAILLLDMISHRRLYKSILWIKSKI